MVATTALVALWLLGMLQARLTIYLVEEQSSDLAIPWVKWLCIIGWPIAILFAYASAVSGLGYPWEED